MCGFAGEVRRDGPPDADALARMQAVLAPRGPDGQGTWIRGRVGLAHRRLAIIDLSDAGAQPMVDPRLGLTVAFNGCIYNHRALRAELEAAGHSFASTSDTEILLKGWAQWGEALLDRLAGMFAFALAEHASGRVVLVALLAEAGQHGLATFSIGFPDAGDREGDEFAFSDLVAREFGTVHHQIRVGADRLVAALPRASAAMSEPMISHDAVAFFLLSEHVARDRKVVQSGQGADEVLGGYHWYPPLLEVEGDGLEVYAGRSSTVATRRWVSS
jgi:asparagine synthetase B (glutamine-hydrolysing)